MTRALRFLLAPFLIFAIGLAPAFAYAQDDDAPVHTRKKKKKKKKTRKKKVVPAPEEDVAPPEETRPDEGAEAPPEEGGDKPEVVEEKPSDKPVDERLERDDGDEESAEIASPLAPYLPEIPALTAHRYAYVGGGLLMLGGLAFAYSAQGEAKRADTVTSVREAEKLTNQARASAATANVLFGIATLTLAYAVAMEFLPEPAREKASLTFHF